jgi:hypothetical protein
MKKIICLLIGLIKLIDCSIAQINNNSLPVANDTINTNTSIITDSSSYATLYVYTSGFTSDDYTFYIDGTRIFLMRWNYKAEIKLYKQGATNISVIDGKAFDVAAKHFADPAKTYIESKRISINMDVEFGNEYYLECKMPFNSSRSNPKFNLVSANEGKPALCTKHFMNAIWVNRIHPQ